MEATILRILSASFGREFRWEVKPKQPGRRLGAPAIPLPLSTALTGITDADIRQTLQALWLASQGEIWRLEAYQRVRVCFNSTSGKCNIR
jgi:hypothetical protein